MTILEIATRATDEILKIGNVPTRGQILRIVYEAISEGARRRKDPAREEMPIPPGSLHEKARALANLAFELGNRGERCEEEIHAALIEATNAELERRRAAEQQLEGLGVGVVVFHTERGSVLRAYNPHLSEWHEAPMVGTKGIDKT